MSTISHIISILLAIGSFLGLPYVPLSSQSPTSFAPTTSIATHTPSAPLAKPAPTPSSPEVTPVKLPTLVLEAPSFKFINPPAGVEATNTVSTKPSTNPPLLSTSTSPTTPTIPTNAISLVQKSVVNIYCTSQNGNLITIVTGSGVLIDPRGVVLTNAHVADQVLQRDYLHNSNNECVARIGSPAVSTYHVALLYLDQDWLALYGKEINSDNQSEETGEGDYALLQITDSLNGSELPVFSYLTPNFNQSFTPFLPLIATAYPAGGLTGQTVINSLFQKTDTPKLRAEYSFTGTASDLIGTTGTIIASRGSSGGAITNNTGELIGLIATTIPDSANPSIEDLQALTLSYINKDIQKNTGLDLKSFLSRDLSSIANSFKTGIEPVLFGYLPQGGICKTLVPQC